MRPDSVSDEDILFIICAAAQLPDNTMHELHAFLGVESLTGAAGSSQWVDRAAAESLQDTWCRLTPEPEIVVTRTGSRRGGSLLDHVFSFLFVQVLKHVRLARQGAGFLAHLP